MKKIYGDFSSILTYYARMLSIQERRVFDVHEFKFEYISYRSIINVDSGQEFETADFPVLNAIDRVSMIEFSISKGELKNRVQISWNCFVIDSDDDRFIKELIEMIDSSTFRFF